MGKVGFIGVGNMGGPMAGNLVKAGHAVRAFDLSADALDAASGLGVLPVDSVAAACDGADVVITVLPEGRHVHAVYADSILPAAPRTALLMDCSTIDVETARTVHDLAAEAGFRMLDAPVSGGVMGAAAATLTMMCGGSDEAFESAKPYLEAMGKTLVHAGGPGNGQAAKICNNMMAGIQMLSVCEAFLLAEKLGLDAQKLFDVSSTASGQCWSLTTYCPEPGPVPTSPANRDYAAGFKAAMMLKDMKLSQSAAKTYAADTPLGRLAASLYEAYVDAGNGEKDFSGIMKMMAERS